MNTINKMPGFTAEASICITTTRYQATTELSVHGGLVQPAGPFDVYRPPPAVHSRWGSPSDIYRPEEFPQFPCPDRYTTIWDPGRGPIRVVVPGFWNSVTQRCE